MVSKSEGPLGQNSENVFGKDSENALGKEFENFLGKKSQDVSGKDSEKVLGEDSESVVRKDSRKSREQKNVSGKDSENVLENNSGNSSESDSEIVINLGPEPEGQDVTEKTRQRISRVSRVRLSSERILGERRPSLISFMLQEGCRHSVSAKVEEELTPNLNQCLESVLDVILRNSVYGESSEVAEVLDLMISEQNGLIHQLLGKDIGLLSYLKGKMAKKDADTEEETKELSEYSKHLVDEQNKWVEISDDVNLRLIQAKVKKNDGGDENALLNVRHREELRDSQKIIDEGLSVLSGLRNSQAAGGREVQVTERIKQAYKRKENKVREFATAQNLPLDPISKPELFAQFKKLGAPRSRRQRPPERERRDPSLSLSLSDRVAQSFYAHGLRCATYPGVFVTFSSLVVLICCLPLRHMPMPGSRPQELFLTAGGFSEYLSFFETNSSSAEAAAHDKRKITEAWAPFDSPPEAYVQQVPVLVLVRVGVVPWTPDLVLTDAFRAPLASTFHLVETVGNTKVPASGRSLKDSCMHIEEPLKSLPSNISSMFPKFNCLIVSPANIWGNSVEDFLRDEDLLKTVQKYQVSLIRSMEEEPQGTREGRSSISDLLFGVPFSETGFEGQPTRNRQRTLVFAITLLLQTYDDEFLDTLRSRLYSLYPLRLSLNGAEPVNESSSSSSWKDDTSFALVKYPSSPGLVEIGPLAAVYLTVFLYVYFSVRNVGLLRSHLRLALATLFTVMASLCMSLAICSHFGLHLVWTGKEVFPYLVVLIGLENTMVLTRSVITPGNQVDPKLRLAQGLSREGWPIIKNLFFEINIVALGFFTFVPAIQEFCLFVLVFFLTTILATVIQRVESTDSEYLHSFGGRHRPVLSAHGRSLNGKEAGSSPAVFHRSSAPPPRDFVASLPRRLRLFYFWARVRFFQRCFILLMVTWIACIIYQIGLLGLLSRTLQVPLNGTTVPPSLAERGASFTPPPLAAP
ncbi:unnamed protein product, partial [Cyprideis torosa]